LGCGRRQIDVGRDHVKGFDMLLPTTPENANVDPCPVVNPKCSAMGGSSCRETSESLG
jgi:hypothetical protein